MMVAVSIALLGSRNNRMRKTQIVMAAVSSLPRTKLHRWGPGHTLP